MTDEVKDKIMEMNIKAYNKGCNDALDVAKSVFVSLKEKGFKSFDIDTIITMIEACKEVGNKIPTTYEK